MRKPKDIRNRDSGDVHSAGDSEQSADSRGSSLDVERRTKYFLSNLFLRGRDSGRRGSRMVNLYI